MTLILQQIIYICLLFQVLSLGVYAVSSTNLVYSVLSLLYLFVLSAFVLFFAEVEFLGWVLILVYAGALAVLFLFVISLLGLDSWTVLEKQFRMFYFYVVFCMISCAFCCCIFFLGFKFLPYFSLFVFDKYLLGFGGYDIALFANFLYTYYAIFFILIGFALFLGLVGSVLIVLPSTTQYIKQSNVRISKISNAKITLYKSRSNTLMRTLHGVSAACCYKVGYGCTCTDHIRKYSSDSSSKPPKMDPRWRRLIIFGILLGVGYLLCLIVRFVL